MKTMRFVFSEAALLAVLTLVTTSPSALAQGLWGNALSFDGVDVYLLPRAPTALKFALRLRRDRLPSPPPEMWCVSAKSEPPSELPLGTPFTSA